MIFSVWNKGKRSYDYFQTPEAAPTHTPTRGVPRRSQLGTAPEAAAWRLPIGAVKIGEGPTARGRVAARGGLGDLESTPTNMLAIAGLLGLTWWIGRRYLR